MDVWRCVQQTDRTNEQSCKDIRLAVRQGEKKKPLSVQHMTSIFWRKTAYTAKQQKIMIKRKTLIFSFFFSFPAPCIYEAVCDWHRVFDKSLQEGGSCFYLGRETATSASVCILFSFSFFCQLERLCFNTWTHTNSYKLRGSEVLLDDFAQEVLQSRTAVFCIFSIPTVNKEYSNDA